MLLHINYLLSSDISMARKSTFRSVTHHFIYVESTNGKGNSNKSELSGSPQDANVDIHM